MIAQPPAQLKALSPYISRANEFESRDGVICFYALYYAVQQALSSGLAQEGACRDYVVSLLERVETLKAELGDNELIADSEAGQAYVENMGLKVFSLAEAEENHGRVGRGTVTKFLAAVSFFEICRQFGEPSQEVTDRVKYAKLHAARIGRAIRDGTDPNAVVRELLAAMEPEPDVSIDANPTEGPSQGAAASPGGLVGNSAQEHREEPSPTPPPAEHSATSDYFPPQHSLPTSPVSSDPISSDQSRDINASVIPSAPGPGPSHVLSPPVPSAPVLEDAPVVRKVPTVDAGAIELAQKHAKWAISALDYEDVATAVKELNLALHKLGSG